MDDREGSKRGGCPEIVTLLGSGLSEERLNEADARAMRAHLAACDSCRALAAADDPTVLFLELRGGALPERFWSGFEAGLRERIDAARPGWTSVFRQPTLAYVTAPLAMLLVVGATLFVMRPGPGGGRRPEWLRSPFAKPAPSAPRSPEAPPIQPGATLAPGTALAPAGRAPAGAELLEGVDSPGARVYRFTVGGPGEETPIYFVVDESIDI
jgi:hypothetical protein